jgi:hypothetical protein
MVITNDHFWGRGGVVAQRKYVQKKGKKSKGPWTDLPDFS